MNQRFEEAKTIYKKLGIDVDEALKQLQTFPVSMHCWQGDDRSFVWWDSNNRKLSRESKKLSGVNE